VNDVCLPTDSLTEVNVKVTLRLAVYRQSKPKLCYDRWSVGQSVLVSSTHLGLKTRFLFLSDSCDFVGMGRPLEVQSYVTTDGQSASLSWNKAPLWGLRPDFYYCLTVASLLMWGALSDERTGLSFARVRPVILSLSLSLILRPTVSWPVCLGIKHPSGDYDQIFITGRQFAGFLMRGALSDERTGLSFTIAAGPRQRSHFRVSVPWDSWPYFIRDFAFRRLRLAGLRCRYSTPPPQGLFYNFHANRIYS
jgi:hypothetical protein